MTNQYTHDEAMEIIQKTFHGRDLITTPISARGVLLILEALGLVELAVKKNTPAPGTNILAEAKKEEIVQSDAVLGSEPE